jgi:hypothetical protein
MAGCHSTRKVTDCFVFGLPEELKPNVLPTYSQVMKFYFLIREQVKSSNHGKDPAFTDIANVVAERVADLWKKSSIPTISHCRIVRILKSYHAKYKNILKSKNKSTESYRNKVKEFLEDAEKTLFDIATCKCHSFKACSCEKDRKVPHLEQPFLIDQRTVRKMIIGGIDLKVTEKLLRKQNRQSKTVLKAATSEQQFQTPKSMFESPEFEDCENEEFDYEMHNDEEYTPPRSRENHSRKTKRETKVISQMRIKLPTTALACDSAGIGDRPAAKIISAVLEDVGMISDNNRSKVTDKNKIRRERKRKRKELQCKGKPEELQALFFDGRKDKTLADQIKGNKKHRTTVIEEHVVLIQEPGSEYIGHVSPASGSAKSIKSSIAEYLLQNDINTETLLAVGCDGTPVNTGCKTGVIRLIEEDVGRPLQWLICMLHANELPLRHLLKKLDGQTSGPETFSGPIGKDLETCELKPVVNFKKVDVVELVAISEELRKDLSTDQQYMLQIYEAVTSGYCSVALAEKKPGKLAHSRWLTAACRVLRLYISVTNVSAELKTLVEFIIKVYVPMWFDIKSKPHCKDGARHLWKMISLSRYLPDDLKTVVDGVISRNAFFAHPENILLSMLTDERNYIRLLAIRRILKARENKQEGIRRFTVPVIKFEAKDYTDLIDWHQSVVTEPPMLRAVSNEDFRNILKEKISLLEIKEFPCHSQAVERAVKIVTDASASVVGQIERDGLIRAKLESQRIIPSFESKSKYKKGQVDQATEK